MTVQALNLGYNYRPVNHFSKLIAALVWHHALFVVTITIFTMTAFSVRLALGRC